MYNAYICTVRALSMCGHDHVYGSFYLSLHHNNFHTCNCCQGYLYHSTLYRYELYIILNLICVLFDAHLHAPFSDTPHVA